MKRIALTLLAILLVAYPLFSQDLPADYKIGKHTVAEWQYVIDTTWGVGLETAVKLEIFDDFWKKVDETYPNFISLDIDWDSMKTAFRPEVEMGVSRGRFAAIIGQLFFSLRDAHTFLTDNFVSYTPLKSGTPLLATTGYWNVDHFGAALTTLPDSNVFVYKVVEDHPLGLALGDIVLGYDGKPWKDLYKELIRVQFPFRITVYGDKIDNEYPGTGPYAYTHTWLSSAGMNWHLFDTIDIVKFGTEDTIHIPTSLLEGQEMKLFADGQLDLPGISAPEIENKKSVVSWGIIDSTSIGYIKSYSWLPPPNGAVISPGIPFSEALISFKSNPDLKGIIIDHRMNEGGDRPDVQMVYENLFNRDFNNLIIYSRGNAMDHNLLVKGPPVQYIGKDNYFDKPIAVLTGPAGKSLGDIFPYILKSHPMARSFGLPTNGAFGSVNIEFPIFNGDSWFSFLTFSNLIDKNNPGVFLAHQDIPADDFVWHDQESVVNGEDAVVNKAIEWISNVSYLKDPNSFKEISKLYSDTVFGKAKIVNPMKGQLRIHAIINNINLDRLDSTIVFEGNTNMNDSIEFLYVPKTEDLCEMDLVVENLDNGQKTGYTRAVYFNSYKKMLGFEGNIVDFDQETNQLRLELNIENLTKYQSGIIDARLEGMDDLDDIDFSFKFNIRDHFKRNIAIHSENFQPGKAISLKVNYTDHEKFDGVDTLKNLMVPLKIDEKEFAGFRFNIHPNPTNAFLTIEVGNSDRRSFEITSLNGQQILIGEMEGSSHQLDLTSFQKGFYLITIRSEDFVTTRQIIKL